MKKKTTYQFKTIKRKGKETEVIYAKTTGEKGKYYKFNGHPYELDAIKEYHEKGMKKGLKTLKERYTKATKYYTKKLPKGTDKETKKLKQKIKRKTPIQHITKGIQTITINNPTTITTTQIKEKTKELLKNLVLDKELLNIITQEQNLQKIKTRFQNTTIYTEQNKTIGRSDLYNATPTEAINEIKRKITKGMRIGYKTLKQTLTKWQNTFYQEGNANQITMKITFRKG